MIKKDILIAVVDGQGGGIGRQYIESLTKQLPKDLPVIIRALGTNSAATSNMMRAGATDGATGENAIVKNAGRADIIVGVVAIVVPDSILGELSPKMSGRAMPCVSSFHLTAAIPGLPCFLPDLCSNSLTRLSK